MEREKKDNIAKGKTKRDERGERRKGGRGGGADRVTTLHLPLVQGGGGGRMEGREMGRQPRWRHGK